MVRSVAKRASSVEDSRKRKQRDLGYAAIGLALALAVVGGVAFPRAQWVIVPVLFWAGVVLVVRGQGWSLRRRSPYRVSAPSRPHVSPLKPGEAYDHPVRLALVPNVPLADVWCQRLRQNGIEAYCTGASPFVAGTGATADLNPALPVEIWVGEHDAGRARQLFPELRS
jgi:hypothetical protein